MGFQIMWIRFPSSFSVVSAIDSPTIMPRPQCRCSTAYTVFDSPEPESDSSGVVRRILAAKLIPFLSHSLDPRCGFFYPVRSNPGVSHSPISSSI